MKFSIQRPTYKQKIIRTRLKSVPRPPAYSPLPNTKIPDSRVRFNNTPKLGNTQLRPRSALVRSRLPINDLGRNHPDEKLVVPEPLIPRSSNVPSMLPITRNRKMIP
jgi:hypothetical protein